MLRQLLTHTRRSSTWILAAIIAVLSVLIALTTRRDGLDLWPDLVSGLSQSGIFTGTLAAGFCAFESSRWVLPASARLAGSARSPLSARMIHAAAVIAPVLLGFLAAVAVLAVTGAVTQRYGAPYLPWLMALGAALVLAGTMGYVIGLVGGRRWYVAPLAALAFLGLYILSRLVPMPYGVKSLFPVIVNTDGVFVRHLPTAMLGQVALFLGVALILVCGVGRGWRHARRMAVAVVAGASVVALAGGFAVISTNGQYLTGYNSRDFVCEGDELEICLNRGYADAMPDLRAQFEDFNDRASGTGLVATKLAQNVEGIGDEPSPGARSVYIEQNNDFGMQLAVARYVNKYGGIMGCDPADLEAFYAVGVVNTWLTGLDELGISTFGDGAPGKAELDRFMALDVEAGNAWFREHEADYMSCSLSLAELP